MPCWRKQKWKVGLDKASDDHRNAEKRSQQGEVLEQAGGTRESKETAAFAENSIPRDWVSG